MTKFYISTALFVLACTPVSSALALESATPTQLPRNVSPRHYAFTITPDAPASRFDAHGVITLDVLAPTATITLNADGLVFHQASLTGQRGKSAPQQASVTVDAAHQTASFIFARPLATGRYLMTLDYTGVIGKQAVGLFSVDYDTGTGKQRALFTQFENSDARRMIPSWDEPAYKATFALDAVVPAAQTAISNMPAASTRMLADGRKAVTFAQTPRMSTYLLFLGVGDFDRVTAKVDGTEVGVVTRKGSSAQAAAALEASQKVLHEYNDYFGVPYPLPKLDNIAAPGRSQLFGAMENWGAIMTFEYAMLLDPATATQADKESVFTFAAHEIAHQWFGNLVTMRWWDNLWLNEGFATWMEGRTTARLHPEWQSALSKVAVRESGMVLDSLATSHPVVQRIDTVEQASLAFDSITYQKGGSVIGMLEAYVGPDAWRSGVRAYIKAHAYGNSVSDDLWREVEKAAHKPVTAIAHDFTLQSGVPMIRVDDLACKDGKASVSLTQEQFSRDEPGKKARRWRVPVIASTVGASSQSRTLVDGRAIVSTPGCGPVIVNAGQSGYYRTLYAPKAFAPLAARFGELASVDQLGLLADSWALSLAGLQRPGDFLDLAGATPVAADPQVWERLAATFRTIDGLYGEDSAARQRFRDFAVGRLSQLMAQVGWTARAEEPVSMATLRETLVYTLASMGDAATLAEARRRQADEASNPPALRKVIRQVVAAKADGASWDALRAQAIAEKSPQTRDQLYLLLASAEDPALARRALDLALTDEPGLTMSAPMISGVAARHPDMAVDFALANIAKINERVNASSRSKFVARLAMGSSDPAVQAKLRAYAQQHLSADMRGEADLALALIAQNIKVCQQRLPAIDAWLASRSK